MKLFSILGPVVLLISAVLTAAYLLPIVIDGFLKGEDYEETCEAPIGMLVPIVILTMLCVALGFYPKSFV